MITLTHSYGEKGSIFVKAYAKALFELINIELKISSTENSHDRSMTDTTSTLPCLSCGIRFVYLRPKFSNTFSQLFDTPNDGYLTNDNL